MSSLFFDWLPEDMEDIIVSKTQYGKPWLSILEFFKNLQKSRDLYKLWIDGKLNDDELQDIETLLNFSKKGILRLKS